MSIRTGDRSRYNRRKVQYARNRVRRIRLSRAELARGMSPDEARYAALRSFGAVEPMKENYRDRRTVTMIETTITDVRYALRTLRKSPGYAAACVLTLALGVGASTAIFSLFDQLVLRDLSAVEEPDRLVMVDWRGTKIGTNWGGGNLMSHPFCRDHRSAGPLLRRRSVPPPRRILCLIRCRRKRRPGSHGVHRNCLGLILRCVGRAPSHGPPLHLGRRCHPRRASRRRDLSQLLEEPPRRSTGRDRPQTACQ